MDYHLMTFTQFAEIYGKSRQAVYWLLKKNKIKCVKISGRMFVKSNTVWPGIDAAAKKAVKK